MSEPGAAPEISEAAAERERKRLADALYIVNYVSYMTDFDLWPKEETTKEGA